MRGGGYCFSVGIFVNILWDNLSYHPHLDWGSLCRIHGKASNFKSPFESTVCRMKYEGQVTEAAWHTLT